MSLISVASASFGYGRKRVLERVSATVEPGEFVGLVGPNGAGKTTFLRGLLGQLPPLEGAVSIAAGQRFAYVPQAEEMELFWPLTIRQTVELGLRGRRLLGRLAPGEAQAASRALERTGLSAIADRPLREASGGQRQRAVLAQALAQEPTVLLLDEPTRGLDIAAEAEFLRLIENVRAERLMTVLFVTHALAIPMNHADRILLFKDGTLIETTPAELAGGDRLERLYGVKFLHVESGGLRWVWPQTKS